MRDAPQIYSHSGIAGTVLGRDAIICIFYNWIRLGSSKMIQKFVVTRSLNGSFDHFCMFVIRACIEKKKIDRIPYR